MKRKFVRVMLFGALALAVSTTVTSCKDYDDDVKGLQEQIDKITSTSPVSTEDMKAAIDAAKTELQGKVTALEALLADKASQTKLESEIARVETALETATGAVASDLATKLATLKNDLTLLINAKADASVVTKLTERVVELEKMKETLSSLIDAEKKFKESGDISGYEGTGFDAFVNQSILDAINPKNEGAIAIYVTSAVQTAITDQATALNTHIATLTGGTITSLERFLDKIYKDIYGEDGKIKKQLDSLNDLLEAINVYVGTGEGEYADYAAIIKQIDDTKKQLAALNLPANKTFDQAVKDAITTELAATDGVVKNLEEKLQKEINALKGMIQSVTYVPTTSTRTVDFTTLYAKKAATDANYSTITLAGASTKSVKFRISPASAAEAFVTNYDVVFSADQVITRSATDQFVIMGEPTVEDGFVTYTIKSNAVKSFAVCMHVKTKSDKIETLGATDITSDYFAALISQKYVVDAYYKVDAAVNKEIAYDVTDGKADYAASGSIVLSVSNSEDGTTPEDVELSVYPGFDIASLNTTFSISNTTDFKIAGSVVTLKAYELPSTIGNTTDVNAKVQATGFYTTATDKKLGTVTVVRTTKKATVDYGEIKATWNNAAQTVAADKFPLNKIYDDANVKLTLAEFKTLTGTVVSVPADKAAFVIATDGSNGLTATVNAQTPAGTYPIKAAFTSEGREIIVTATIKVENPTFASLMVDPVLWKGTALAGNVGFTPTLDATDKPSDITLEYDLSKLFTNYATVLTAINATPGAKLEITVPNYSNITGLSYVPSTTVLTFNKDTYTGKTTDNKVAKVQVVAKITLAGTTESLQSFKADVSINNISGSWISGSQSVTLSNKAATTNLSTGFAWSDMRGKAMWKDGAEVTGNTDTDSDFADGVKALDIYGLNAPAFSFVDNEGEVTTSKYLAISATTGELTFTETGKTFNFQIPVTVRVKVSASSQWGVIEGYAGKDIITVTIPAGIK